MENTHCHYVIYTRNSIHDNYDRCSRKCVTSFRMWRGLWTSQLPHCQPTLQGWAVSDRNYGALVLRQFKLYFIFWWKFISLKNFYSKNALKIISCHNAACWGFLWRCRSIPDLELLVVVMWYELLTMLRETVGVSFICLYLL